ncbi:MAG: dCMP deaminase [Thermoleophilaceae bacterium]|nr:dCMP deaminase [Thermoleophilaceae bacterium]
MARSKAGAKALSSPSVPASVGASYLPRIKQVQWDHYYMDVALTVKTRANCWGALVGAVLVLENRIVSTGFNGTPSGFANCRDGGCERCRQRELHARGELEHVTEPEVASGPKQLDLCLCVHAEANALLSAAKFGNHTEGSWLYTTSKPCFACLKEAYQAGVKRIVYLEDWDPTKSKLLQKQYDELVEHLADGNPRNFERLARQRDVVAPGHGEPRSPDLDERIDLPDAAAASPPKSRPGKGARKRPGRSDDAAPRKTRPKA